MGNNNDFKELIESAASYAGNLYNGLEKAFGFLREDEADEGVAMFVAATEGLEWLFGVVKGLNSVDDRTTFSTDAVDEFLGEMLVAFENKDYVLLADLLEYEILPIIDEWGNKLDDMLESYKR